LFSKKALILINKKSKDMEKIKDWANTFMDKVLGTKKDITVFVITISALAYLVYLVAELDFFDPITIGCALLLFIAFTVNIYNSLK
jgi:hypothetical protein